MLEFLYCFDKNYNPQAITSIFSLLENVTQKININIIHESESDQLFLPCRINQHRNLNKINIFKFTKNNLNFPNLEKSHVSEATYFRLFIEEYFSNQIQVLIYLDADIICINDPIKILNSLQKQLIASNYIISSKTEHFRNTNFETFNRLDLKSNKYFNAGVMLIDFNKWRKSNIKQVLVNEITKEKYEFKFWDQDLLNIFFDGEYLELNQELNKVIDLAAYEYNNFSINVDDLKKENIFIHFAGSHKPWFINGILCNLSEIYQNYYRAIFKEQYHIQNKMKKISIRQFLNGIKNLSFFKTKYPLKLFLIFMKNILIKSKVN